MGDDENHIVLESLNDHDGDAVIHPVVVLLGLTMLLAVFRVWARQVIARELRSDDVFLFIGLLLFIAWCGLCISAAYFGLGHHLEEVNATNMKMYLKSMIAASVLNSWSIASVKISFATLYMRIFDKRWVQVVNKGLIVLLIAQSIMASCIVMFRCSPVHKSWDFQIDGTCLDLHPMWYTVFILNLVSDLVLFLHPIHLLWQLKLPIEQRIGLMFMMSVGLLVTVVSVMRLKYVIYFYKNANDFDTYDMVAPTVWATAEIASLIICACLPSVRKVASLIPCLQRVVGSAQEKNRASQGKASGEKSNDCKHSRNGGQSGKENQTASTGHSSTVHRQSTTESTEGIMVASSKPGIMGITVTREVEVRDHERGSFGHYRAEDGIYVGH